MDFVLGQFGHIALDLDVEKGDPDTVQIHCRSVIGSSHLVVVVRVYQSHHARDGVGQNGDQRAQHPPSEELDFVAEAQT